MADLLRGPPLRVTLFWGGKADSLRPAQCSPSLLTYLLTYRSPLNTSIHLDEPAQAGAHLAHPRPLHRLRVPALLEQSAQQRRPSLLERRAQPSLDHLPQEWSALQWSWWW